MDTTRQVSYGRPGLLRPETLAKIVVEPGVSAVRPTLGVSAVMTFAVPLQVAEPLLSVAVVGGVVAPYPDAVTVSCVPLAIVFVPVNGTVAVAPMTPEPPGIAISEVMTFAVPLQVAVPLLNVAVVGAVVAPDPSAVTVSCVPLVIVFVPVNGTVAVAPVTPLKLDRLQVWPAEPVVVPPEV
jgi:nitrate reductase NapE component